MENQSRFHLNEALQRWRLELGCQPGISPEDLRELETHLLDSVSALEQRGVAQEEAFARSQKRLGSASQVGAEFAKAYLLRIWRDRVFWIAFFGFVTELYSSAARQPLIRLAYWLRESAGGASAVLAVSLLAGLPILFLAILMASGRAEFLFGSFWWLFGQRWRLGTIGVAAAIAVKLLSYSHAGGWFVFELALLGFAIFVMPLEIRAVATLKGRAMEDRHVWRDRLFWVLLAHLAIGAWSMIMLIGANAYRLHIPESRQAALPLMLTVLFLAIWLLPMGAVGLGLWTGHLSLISRAARSRWHVALIAGGLALMSVGAKFWVSTWNIPFARLSNASWKFEFMLDALCSLFLGAVFVALMVWVVPWQRQWKSIQQL